MGWAFWKKRQPGLVALPPEGAIERAENTLARAMLGGAPGQSAEIEDALTTLDLAKAAGIESPLLKKARKYQQGKVHDLDPYDVLQAGDEASTGDIHLGTGGIGYYTLSQMAATPTVSAIINTRANQLSEFMSPSLDDDDLGYVVRLRDRRKSPSKAEVARANELTDWYLECGQTGYLSGLEAFSRQFISDSLTWDQACFENIFTRGGDIAGFLPADSATIRRAIPSQKEFDKGKRNFKTSSSYVQVVRQEVVAEWRHKELAFCIRRPRTRIAVRGYGHPELESLIRMVTGILHGESYNEGNFTHGLHAAGVLALKSNMGKELFRTFQRDFYSMMSGAHNARKTPIIQLDPNANEDLLSINMSQNNREMEFQQWMAYLQKMVCANFQMDPAELGFIHGNEGQTSSVFQQGPEQRILASKEKGLRPLVRFFFRCLNRHVMVHKDPLYEIVPVGLDAAQREARLERELKRLTGFCTYNEARAKYDLPRIDNAVDGGAADLIGDPAYQNTALQMLQMRREDAADRADGLTAGGVDPFAQPALDPDSTEPIDIDSLFPDDAEAETAADDVQKGFVSMPLNHYVPHAPESAARVPLYVSALLPESVAAQWPGVKAPHITLLYTMMAPECAELARKVVKNVIEASNPACAALKGVDYFRGAPSGDVAYMAVDDALGTLQSTRFALMEALAGAGFPHSLTFPEYIPHATLGTVPDGCDWNGPCPEMPLSGLFSAHVSVDDGAVETVRFAGL